MDMSLDTVILVVKLTSADEEWLQDRFTFTSYNKSFKKSLSGKDPFFVLNINLRNKYGGRFYNAMLIMQNETLNNMPDYLQEILLQFNWIPKRLDFAFDSQYGFSFHSILKYAPNVKLVGDKRWKGYYIGGVTSKQRMNIYDRNEKEKARNNNITHKMSTRFEIRIRPQKLSEQSNIHNLDYNWIIEAMKKYIVVENNDTLKLWKAEDKRKIKLLRRKPHDPDDYNNKWRAFSRKQKDLYKAKMLDQRIPFEQLFLDNVESLFSWIPTKNDDEVSMNEVVPSEMYTDEVMEELFA